MPVRQAGLFTLTGDMSKYLLLRNNKQAGPYTLEEIKEMALKAYDLVWVEGKSAAWRYPGEIEELKSFAPLVEEQPFDRFFKKPSDQSSNTYKQTSTEIEKTRYAPAVSEQMAASPVNKAIYINLPAESKTIEEKQPQEHVERNQPVREKVIQREPLNKELSQKSFSQPLPSARIEPAGIPDWQTVPEDNFSSSSDELKNQYVERVSKYHKKNPADFRRLVKPIAIGFGLMLLLVAGIFIGLFINNRGINSTQKSTGKDQTGVLDQQSIYSTKTVPVSSSLPSDHQDKSANNSLSGQGLPANTPDEKSIAEKKRIRAAKQKIADNLRAAKTIPVKTDSSVYITQRDTEKKPAEAQNEKASIKNNIEDYVALSASKFNVGTFGGISDLQLTVSNTSPFPLDLVVVEVQYIQSNKKIFKTENLYFHNITAGAATMEEAPKSSRGIKVKYRITIISSKNIGISFSEL